MTKARIKSTGKIVDVISRFMPKKRNAPSRDWVCNLSDGTCINESEIEYLNDSIQEKLNKKASEYANKHYSEWEEHWYDYNGYNTEPENDKLELIDAFIAGAEWMTKQGVSYQTTISADKTIPVLPMKDVSDMGLDYGDKVIVQIRGKQ